MARKPTTPPLADMAADPLAPNPNLAPDNLTPILVRLETLEEAVRIMADVVQKPQPVTLSPEDVTLIGQVFSFTIGEDLIEMHKSFSAAKEAIEALPTVMENAEKDGKAAQAKMGRAVAEAVREFCGKAGDHIKDVGAKAREEMTRTVNSAKPDLDSVTEHTKKSLTQVTDEMRAAAITTANAAKRELTASTAAAEDVQARIGLTVSQLEKAMDDLDYCNPATSQNAERRLFRVGRYMSLVTAALVIAGFGLMDLIVRKYGL